MEGGEPPRGKRKQVQEQMEQAQSRVEKGTSFQYIPSSLTLSDISGDLNKVYHDRAAEIVRPCLLRYGVL